MRAVISLFLLLVLALPVSGEEGEVVIGVIAPLSGPIAGAGEELRAGAELAAEVVNGNVSLDLPLARRAGIPGLGDARVRLVFGGDGSDPEKGASEARRLLVEENAVALMGAVNSDVTARASEVAEEMGVPFLCPISTRPFLTQRGFRWFFRLNPSDDVIVDQIFDFLDEMRLQNRSSGRVALLYVNSSLGRGFYEMALSVAEERGYDVVAEVSYPQNETDFIDEVEQLRAAGEAVLLQASDLEDAVASVRAFREAGYAPTAVIANDGGFLDPRFLKAAKNASENLLVWDLWNMYVRGMEHRPDIRALNDLYRDRYGVNLEGNSAAAFTGVMVLADALDRAGSADPEAVQLALSETNLSQEEIIMPWGGVRFDPETHQNDLVSCLLVQVHRGRYRTVWPPEFASSELVWPFPGW